MPSQFFALLSRMKYINRWGLMRNTRYETLCEHSYDVAVIAHALALIRNKRFGGDLNAERAALLGLYHDAPEILTGDLPTPVKYFNPKTKDAYAEVEKTAGDRFLSMLPEDFQEDYAPLFRHDKWDAELWTLVKAADKISALVKCMDEEKSGNREFASAGKALRKKIEAFSLPEVDFFLEEFLPAFAHTLDEHTK